MAAAVTIGLLLFDSLLHFLLLLFQPSDDCGRRMSLDLKGLVLGVIHTAIPGFEVRIRP